MFGRQFTSINTLGLFLVIAGFASILCSSPSLAVANSANDSNEFVIGIFPRRNAETTVQLFTPLAKYLESQLNKPVRIVTAKNFETFWLGVQTQKYDLVHYNQYHYVKSNKLQGYTVILKNEEFNEDTIAGSIVVRNDSGINTVSDLRGKKIVFGGNRSAMQSYIVATYLLRRAGLQPGDYKEAFSRNPPNAIFAAYYGQSDAGGTGDKVLQLPVVTNKIDVSKMKVLVHGEQLPHLPWAVNKNMSESDRTNLQNLLADLKYTDQGKQILSSAKLTGLNIASDNDYDSHREMIFAVLNEDYCRGECSHTVTAVEKNANRPLVLGIFPRRAQAMTEKMFKPVADYLKQILGRDVILKTPKDFENFWGDISERQYDIVHLNQYQYVKSHKLYNYNIILKNEENNSSNITPALMVRKDSDIQTVADLKGKHVMFGGDNTAMISYIAAVDLLKHGGLTEKDYIGSFAINPTNTCRLVVSKQADACAGATLFLEIPSIKKLMDVSQLRILATGESMPHLPWAIKNDLDADLAKKIQRALVSLNTTEQGQEILKAAALNSLQIASDREYNVYRRLIRDVLNERY